MHIEILPIWIRVTRGCFVLFVCTYVYSRLNVYTLVVHTFSTADMAKMKSVLLDTVTQES